MSGAGGFVVVWSAPDEDNRGVFGQRSPYYRFVGCGGGSYCPRDPVTREQMAVFLAATFNLFLYGP